MKLLKITVEKISSHQFKIEGDIEVNNSTLHICFIAKAVKQMWRSYTKRQIHSFRSLGAFTLTASPLCLTQLRHLA